MKKALWALMGVFALCGFAQADDSAILNDPKVAWDHVKEVVDYLDPQVDWTWHLTDAEVVQGYSARIARLDPVGLRYTDLRLGYGVDKTVLAGLALNLEQIYLDFTPEHFQETFPGKAALLVAKYASVGFSGGWNDDTGRTVYGPTVSVKGNLKF